MTLATRLRERASTAAAPAVRPRAVRRPRPTDVLFVVAVSLLLAAHGVIFFAVLALAPETAAEQRALQLVQLPVEVARALVLPFHALLLGSLFVLGRRAAGRWAGFGSMLAVLALDLRADPSAPVYGPPTAGGGWIAAALLAAAFVVVPQRRLLAAVLAGAASGFFATAALALPGFLLVVALFPAPLPERGGRPAAVLRFAGAWAVPAALFQLAWFSRLGAAGYGARVDELLAEFRPHALVPWLQQEVLVFAAWHFAALVTFLLAISLFLAAGTGVARYFLVRRPGEAGPLRVLRRFPASYWVAALTLLAFSAWWGLSGSTDVIGPNLPVLAAVAPLFTAMAYRGAKWLLTVNRFWALAAIVYLTGLILVRSLQLTITLVQAFQY